MNRFLDYADATDVFVADGTREGIDRVLAGVSTRVRRANPIAEAGAELDRQGEELAEDFRDTLRALIEHCLSPDAGGFTASDFADFQWGEADLSAIAGAIQQSQQGASESADESEEDR